MNRHFERSLSMAAAAGIFACTIMSGAPAQASGSGPAAYSLSPSPLPDGLGYSGIVQGPDGSYYTYAVSSSTNQNGSIERITPDGTVTDLHDFTDADGAYPNSLVLGSDGSFYGTALYGGDNGYGTVFRITTAGAFSRLYSFGPDPTGGVGPGYSLVEGRDGNFYGLTLYGGANSSGSVFRISPSGAFTMLASLADSPDSIFKGSDGNVYYSVAVFSPPLSQTLFRIASDGSPSAVFSSCGAVPLMQAGDGNFYGRGSATPGLAPYLNLVRISPDCSTITVLHTPSPFPVQSVWIPGHWEVMRGGWVWVPGAYEYHPTYINLDGGSVGSLVQAADGTIYGTMAAGGVFGASLSGYSVFRLGTDGIYQSLLSFPGAYEFNQFDGANLMPISLDASGNLLVGAYRIPLAAPLTTQISFSKPTVYLGEATRLNWSSTGAQSCQLVGNVTGASGSVATSGSKTLRLYSKQNYDPAQFIAGIQCTAADGSLSNASASIAIK